MDPRDLASEIDALSKVAEALRERIANNDQLVATWARVDQYFAELRAVSGALARAADKATEAKLRIRWNAQIDLLNSALSIVETMLRAGGTPAEDSAVAALIASTGSSLANAEELSHVIRELEDLELRRLAGAFGDHLERARLALSELERYYKRVYRQGK